MYIPPANLVRDKAEIAAFMRAHGFATLVTQQGGAPWASHVPVLLREAPEGDRIWGHVARGNEQWKHFASGQEALCIFHGPHAYISPSWYTVPVAVPTWNYAVVHAYGTARIEDDAAVLRQVLEETTSKYEKNMPAPWSMARLPEDYIASMMKAIVGFSIRITRIEAKFKLGQNRSQADRDGTLAHLEKSEFPDSRALAAFIRALTPPA